MSQTARLNLTNRSFQTPVKLTEINNCGKKPLLTGTLRGSIKGTREEQDRSLWRGSWKRSPAKGTLKVSLKRMPQTTPPKTFLIMGLGDQIPS